MATPPASADVATIAATRDNTLYEPFEELSNGAGAHFFAGLTNGAATRRGLLAFDVAGAIPAGSTITAATLTLHMSRSLAGDTDVTLHRLLADWGEGGSDASDEEGIPAPAEDGDATWSYTFYDTGDPAGSPAWSTPGAEAGVDFVAVASASARVGGTGFYAWSSAAMVSDVQAWLDDPGGDFGWLVIGRESGFRTAKRFDSRQHGTAGNRPQLEVVYTPSPLPGACCADDGSCSEASGAACAGLYLGPGSVCAPDPCAAQTGACCADDASCTLVLEPGSACAESYAGAGSVCVPNACPLPPTGACCFPDAAATCGEGSPSDCAAVAGAYQGDGTQCTPNPCPVVLEPFVDALPIPAVAQPTSGAAGGAATYELAMREVQQQLHRDLPPTTVWGFGDGPTGASFPGPTIEATSGQPVTVTWVNDLRDTSLPGPPLRTEHFLPVDTCPHGVDGPAPRTVVHLHGGHVAAEFDGYPEDTFLPGEQAVYVYPNGQLPATLWYHDHALGITRLNVYMGLAGLYLIRDAVEQSLGLPSGEFEIPLAIQDRSFEPDGSLRYPSAWQDMVFGNTVLVNGKAWPFLDVKQGKYRFRILDGSGSRSYTLSLSSGAPFHVLGQEGGLLPAPVMATEITLGPGERADVVVDFAPYPAGTEILLVNSAPAPFPGEPGVGVVPEVIKFVVGAETGHTAPLPASLRPMEVLDEQDAVMSRDFELEKGPGNACSPFVWLINGLGWDDITEYPELGSTEVWRFINRSGVTHPMHMHLVMFQVLDRQPFQEVDGSIAPIGSPAPPAPVEAGWRDTVAVGPGEIVRVIARFEDFTGRYAYHCHILEHEDHEMMRQFEVVPEPGPAALRLAALLGLGLLAGRSRRSGSPLAARRLER
ncbi:MAG: multicopper oxidase domain-containing protein [Myxococcota bacterium]|nr:multicopper oxidase domain-containing protein [Myxococcota bacterium]